LRIILRNARVAANKTQKQAAAELYWSTSKLMRLENGAVRVTVTDLRALLSLYGITDEGRVDELVGMARIARYHHWTTYRDVLSPEFIAYLGYENAAATIRSFQSLLLPGLLQTADYARAVLRIVAGGNEPRIQRLLDARLTRQRLLFQRENPPQMFFMLDEAVLRRKVGSCQVTAAQLEHLVHLAARPHVHLRVLGFEKGVHPGMNGPFAVLEFADLDDGEVIFLEGWSQMVVREGPGSDFRYRTRFAQLEAMAAPESEFVDIVRAIRAE
jgi:transcriptional regulator with XRE-family HTH domain